MRKPRSLKLRSLEKWAVLIACFYLSVFSVAVVAQELTLAEKVQARITGPFHFRLLLQPLTAFLMGWRDGRLDAIHARPPVLIHLLTAPGRISDRLKQSLMSIHKPLFIGMLADALVQFLLFGNVRILGAIAVGISLIAIPYLFSRGITNRLLTNRSQMGIK